jgi:hypothetical protein
MFSLGTPTSAMTTSQAIGETPSFLVYGDEVCLPSETLLDSPRAQSFDGSMQERLQREDVEMHIATRRSGVTTNGLCVVWSSRSGPSPTASTEPRRGLQSLP